MALFQLRNVCIILLVLSPIGLYLLSNELVMDAVPIDKPPYTHFSGLDPSREVYVSWENSRKMNASLWLGKSPSSLVLNVTNITNSPSFPGLYRVKLANLQANTRYYYRVESVNLADPYTSPVGSFLTAPNGTLPFTAAFFSDSQQLFGIGHYERIADAIASREGFSFVSPLGDLAQEPDSQPNWNLYWKQSEGWTRDAAVVPTIGNHDSTFDDGTEAYVNPHELMYLKYFGFCYDSGPWAGHFFYHFNWSNVQFVVAEIGASSQEDITLMNQSAWLNETLERGQDKAFRVLLFHRAMYSSIGNVDGFIARLKPIIDEYNVSLVMYGHHHHYERFLVDGRTYLCLGGGGGMQDTAFNVVPESQFLNVGPSYTTVDFGIDRLFVETRSEEDAVIESFTLVRNGSAAELLGGGAA
ncbi:MAG: metallophosphoesterase family protein [Candidatus Lokiarchaeota archaeon]|nr:metallophosphoesterase family protein [Candidatus Lokiarchaeota archaeon]